MQEKIYSQEILACEQELKGLGFSEIELQELYQQIDGIIERILDNYFDEIYDI
jgi:hypothetical protein